MNPDTIAAELKTFKTFFDRSTACLVEDDSAFAPVEGQKTVAQHVAHVAQTVDWFIAGAFRPEGFEMDFERLEAETIKVESLSAAREWLDRAFAAAAKAASGHSAEEWAQTMPQGPIMGGMPRFVILGGINDHTAHHRGALAVYARLRGRVPAMPYM
jgi:uncharacterized damage-inducible protein DinB